MYKYVQRRLRDIVERTYSILDVQKSWACKNADNGGHQTKNSSGCVSKNQILVVRPAFSEHCSTNQKNGELWLIPEPKDPGRKGNKEKCNKKEQPQCDFTWISALTWSSALVCGWYASQLLCLHRRNIGWDTNSKGCYSKLFMSPSRTFHTNILTRLVFAVPPFPRSEPLYETPRRQYHHLKRVEPDPAKKRDDSGVFEPRKSSYSAQNVLEDHEELYDVHKYVINISNDDEEIRQTKERRTVNIPSPGSTKNTKTVEQAVKELLSVLGEIEFQLGIKSINVGDFETGVSHFKLATSHQHAGATFNLGICFEHGLGIRQDMAMAMTCYQIAADLGHPQAIYNLGIFYAQGLGGLKKNRKAAKKCFETAAQLGVMEAKLALGLPKKPSVVSDALDTQHYNSAINLQQIQTHPVYVS